MANKNKNALDAGCGDGKFAFQIAKYFLSVTGIDISKELLKSGGYFVGINIGEKDCQDIKEIFGRGQGFGQWNASRQEKDKQELKNACFEVVFAQDYFYDEYYASYGDLDLFLQGVPIFEDFDSEKDKKHQFQKFPIGFRQLWREKPEGQFLSWE